MEKALAYSLSRWEKLMLYCTDGRLEIDNNLVENAIRPVAIGRKNYLFAGSHDAAQRAAMIYSMLGTCKCKAQNLFLAKKLFEVIPDYKANKMEEFLLENLLLSFFLYTFPEVTKKSLCLYQYVVGPDGYVRFSCRLFADTH
ncbi:MAG: transposase [Bacteroidetes bacterium]|nr:transposase [Bacteroidota bacterium]